MKKIVTITNPADKTIKQALVELYAAIGRDFINNCDVDFTSTVVPNIKTANENPVFFVIEHNAKNDTFSLYDNAKDEYLLIDRPSTIKYSKLAARIIFIRTMCENVNFESKKLDYEITVTPAKS